MQRRWWHLSQETTAPEWVAARICPPRIGDSEPTTPRLCVADSIEGCLSARWWSFGRDIMVYRTEPRRAINPGVQRVWDCTMTGERWIVPPCKLTLEAVIEHRWIVQTLTPFSGSNPHHRLETMRIGIEMVRNAIPHLASEKFVRFFKSIEKPIGEWWEARQREARMEAFGCSEPWADEEAA
jgi:hypothetical protein